MGRFAVPDGAPERPVFDHWGKDSAHRLASLAYCFWRYEEEATADGALLPDEDELEFLAQRAECALVDLRAGRIPEDPQHLWGKHQATLRKVAANVRAALAPARELTWRWHALRGAFAEIAELLELEAGRVAAGRQGLAAQPLASMAAAKKAFGNVDAALEQGDEEDPEDIDEEAEGDDEDDEDDEDDREGDVEVDVDEGADEDVMDIGDDALFALPARAPFRSRFPLSDSCDEAEPGRS